MVTPERAAMGVWAAWAVSWWAAAVWRKPAAARAGAGAELLHLVVTALGFWLLFFSLAGIRWRFAPAPLDTIGPMQLWRLDDPAGWGLVAVVAAGFALCWWARLHLGDLWSGTVTRKEGHRVIDSGPYARVRHPIYTGLIMAALATGAIRGTTGALAGAGIIILGLWIKARVEERFLRAELGAAEYDAYAARTPMLIPRLGPSPAKS
jgi:protein-S-isoprenylcysteine O-methyltransferase Ste14